LLAMQAVGSMALTVLNCRWQGQPVQRFLRDAVGRGIPTFLVAAGGVPAAHRIDGPAASIATLLTIAGCFLLTWLTWLNPDGQHWMRRRCRAGWQPAAGWRPASRNSVKTAEGRLTIDRRLPACPTSAQHS